MNSTEQQIAALLERKQHIDDVVIGGGVDLAELIQARGLNWLIEGVELLLRHQFELREELRKEMSNQLRKELCRQITKEVFEELRNNGIVR